MTVERIAAAVLASAVSLPMQKMMAMLTVAHGTGDLSYSETRHHGQCGLVVMSFGSDGSGRHVGV